MSGFDVIVRSRTNRIPEMRKGDRGESRRPALRARHRGTGAAPLPKLVRLRNNLGSQVLRSGSARATISVECQARELWLRFRSFRSLWYLAFLPRGGAPPIRARGFNMVMLKCQNHHEARSSWDAIVAELEFSGDEDYRRETRDPDLPLDALRLLLSLRTGAFLALFLRPPETLVLIKGGGSGPELNSTASRMRALSHSEPGSSCTRLCHSMESSIVSA